jgi:nucleotide-binding universal stress UspA family protein
MLLPWMAEQRMAERSHRLETILVPTDFSTHAERAIASAVELAARFGARVVLLHACHVELPTTGLAPGSAGSLSALQPGLVEQLRKSAETGLADAMERYSDRGVTLSARVETGPVVAAILEAARTLPADLIVMGSRGRTGLAHVVLGSIAEATVRAAPCPVLSVKSTTSSEERA